MPSLLPMVRSMTLYDRPFPQTGSPECTHRDVDFRMAISPQRVIRSTSRFGSMGFQGRRIERRYISGSIIFKMAAGCYLGKLQQNRAVPCDGVATLHRTTLIARQLPKRLSLARLFVSPINCRTC